MRCNEVVTGILIAAALIGWGVSALGNRIVAGQREEVVQVCEQFDETTTVCRTVGIGALGRFIEIEPLLPLADEQEETEQ